MLVIEAEGKGNIKIKLLRKQFKFQQGNHSISSDTTKTIIPISRRNYNSSKDFSIEVSPKHDNDEIYFKLVLLKDFVVDFNQSCKLITKYSN